MHRTDHVVEPSEVGTPCDAENDGAKERSNETLDGLLRRQCDERRTSESDTPDVGKDVVADDQGSRHPEPDEAFEDVVDNEVTA